MSIERSPVASRAAVIVAVAGILALGAAPVAGPAPAVARHVAVAKAAAGTQWEGLLEVLCAASDPSLAPPAPPAASASTAPAVTPHAPGASGASAASPSAVPAAVPAAPTAATVTPAPAKPAGPPERSSWYAPPVQVFDNLYYVGMTEYSAWAVTTSAGIILIDTLYDYSVEAEVVDGLRQLGLDPASIEYAIVSHGHADHSGGAKYLQDTFGTKIVLSAADWDLLDRSTGTRPRRDVVASDGMALTLGDTTLRLMVTPGHTLGTISTIIPLKDHGRPHVAATWGGTAFNWLKNRDGYISAERPDAFWFRHYIASAERFATIAAKAKADVLLSNHTVFDGSKTKLAALRTRTSEQPHPYVVGAAGVHDYLTVASECARAGLGAVAR